MINPVDICTSINNSQSASTFKLQNNSLTLTGPYHAESDPYVLKMAKRCSMHKKDTDWNYKLFKRIINKHFDILYAKICQ